MRVSRKILGAGVFLLVLSFASNTLAQASMPAKHLQMYTIQVKAGADAQFADYMKKIMEAANKVGAPQGWMTAQAALGAEMTNYYVILGFDKWAERDGWNQVPQMLTKAFGETEAQKIIKMGGEATWSFDTKVFSLDEERSWNLKARETAPFYQLLIGKVKPDMVEQYQMVISQIKEAMEKAPEKQMGIRRSTSLGPSWEFYYATPMEKWSDRDNMPSPWENVAKIHGEATAQHLQNTLRSCYTEREIFIVAARPDLSRPAPAPSTN